ncbi:hypothetical protein [Streptomyces sp. NPDC049915]|uniref:hypothetical protein n=1 Tax=Streptomyces sp. NPDC049915 TaxID=3155510 RepID=UPI003440B6AD
MASWDEDGIRARIREMAAQDPERKRFGARTHQYALAPQLPETEIRTFEVSHGIALPGETGPSSRRSATARPGPRTA